MNGRRCCHVRTIRESAAETPWPGTKEALACGGIPYEDVSWLRAQPRIATSGLEIHSSKQLIQGEALRAGSFSPQHLCCSARAAFKQSLQKPAVAKTRTSTLAVRRPKAPGLILCKCIIQQLRAHESVQSLLKSNPPKRTKSMNYRYLAPENIDY